jgi:hypothetical protein
LQTNETGLERAEQVANAVHALTAARSLPSEAAVKRLVTITLDGLRPPPPKSKELVYETPAR